MSAFLELESAIHGLLGTVLTSWNGFRSEPACSARCRLSHEAYPGRRFNRSVSGAATTVTQRQLGIQRVHGLQWCCWLRSGLGRNTAVYVDFRRVPEYRHSGLHFLPGWSGAGDRRNYFADDGNSVRFCRLVWRSFKTSETRLCARAFRSRCPLRRKRGSQRDVNG